jgi:predicted nucleotidyltransferase
MQITPGQKIAGQSAIVLRNALRHLRDGTWSSKTLAYYLKVPPMRAQRIIMQLAKAGYIERDELAKTRDAWCLTNAGRALTNANAMRPLPRGQAKVLIDDFLARVKEVNADPYFLYQVSKVILFGSYLSKKETLGDLDLAIELSPKEPNKDRFEKLIKKRSQDAVRSGRQFSTYIDELAWPETEVRRFLKGRARYISLHSASDGILKTCAKRVIYRVARTSRNRGQ